MKLVWITALWAVFACSTSIGGGQSAGPDAAPGIGPDAGPGPDDSPPAPGAAAPARYPAGSLRSPITRSVADRLSEIYQGGDDLNERVFMKVGASGTVSSRFLDCFSGDQVELDGRDHLADTIAYFDAPEAAGEPSWTRDTLAAEVGRSAGWVIGGDPSPLAQEIAAIAPRAAVVNYGTNDMGLGSTYESALWPFHENFSELLDQLEARAILPIITGLNPRSDSLAAARWVPTYNAVTRAVAEDRQLPYINLYEASVDLPDMGLAGDGIHGNAFVDGQSRPCVFTEEALQFNYNARNLLTLETLHDVRRVVLEGEAAPDPDTEGYAGTGSPEDPFVIDRVPFTHHADTGDSPHSAIDAYPACDSGQDESGAELYYRLELSEPTPLRILVLDRSGVDIDIHLLNGSPDPASCIERDHRIIERTLAPGAYYLALDTFVSESGSALAGRYSLVVVACEPGDVCE